jgi:hypothetical protein
LVKSLTLKLPADLYRWLAEESRRSGRSKSDLVREALQRRRQKKKVSALDLCGDLAGIVSSGLGDLSTNKKHLEGFGE